MRARWRLGSLGCVITSGCVGLPPPPPVDEAATLGSTTEPSAETVPSLDATSTGFDTSGTGVGATGTTMSDSSAHTTSDTGPVPVCGDGVAEADEQCDTNALAGGTCQGVGFDGGTLACSDDCTYDTVGCGYAPMVPELALAFSQVKQFDFSWAAVPDADYYQLLESPEPGAPYLQVGGDIMAEAVSYARPLHFRYEASYVLSACNAFGCTDSLPVAVTGSLAEAVGYLKASNTGQDDDFGFSVALSADGNTLAVGAPGEDSSATGINGAQAAGANDSGAVYVFVRDPATNAWTQQAYVKASNTGAADDFGVSVALSADGGTLAVGADLEDSSATGINGAQGGGAYDSGAVYVFVRDGAGNWTQQAYVKPFNTGAYDLFGRSVALAGDGDTLAVSAWQEDSNATGIGGNGLDNTAPESGAVYVFVRNAMDQWSQQAYVKASNTDAGDIFGWSVALSGDGNTLAVAAGLEDGGSSGVDGNQADDSVANAGAVYVFVRDGVGMWSQEAYVKASNPDQDDGFGWDVALSDDGDMLLVGAPGEDSSATGIDGDELDDAAPDAGAAYMLVRDGTGTWSQQAYLKPSNADQDDYFGAVVTLSADGSTAAVGAWEEDGSAVGLQGDGTDDATANAGACYVLVRDGAGTWLQQAYVKAPNPGIDDLFSADLALSGDAGTLAVGAYGEDSAAFGIGGDLSSNGASNSGAVYLY